MSHQPPRRRMCVRSRGVGSLRGFTLIEMLVSMVIVSLAIGIVTGSFFQIGRLIQSLETKPSAILPHWYKAELLQQGMSNLVLDLKDANSFMVGNNVRFRAMTVRHPLAMSSARLPFSVHLDDGPDVPRSRLVIDSPDGTASAVVYEAPQSLSFEYRTSKGQTVDQWPADPQARERLPTTIVLKAADTVVAVWTYPGLVVTDPFTNNALAGLGGGLR